ncbi:hypothetical protein BH20VER2_BH20VER2_02640 [soil metagenome]
MSRSLFAFACAVVVLIGAPFATAAPPERTVSTSRQFIVHGPEVRLRGAICDIGERTKRHALALLQDRDGWATPILVRAQLPQANRPELPRAHLHISQTGFGLKLQLELLIDGELNAAAIERELLRAVFLEMIYRHEPNTPAGVVVVEPPDWLLDGTLALAGEDTATIAEALATVSLSGQVLPVPKFLRQRPGLLDSPSRTLYRAYSAALVALLRDSPDGRVRLRRFLASLPHAPNDSFAHLQEHFPILHGEAEQIQEAWIASVAQVARRERFRLLSCGETERQLSELLRVGLRKPGQVAVVYTLEEYPKFVDRAEAAAALQLLTHQLLLFSARSHPLYRPVLTEYQEIVAQLVRRRTRRLDQRLAEIRGTREHIVRRMDAIDDYLNWFEATQSRTASGAFSEYMRAAELAQERQTRRRDPISVYLDALESQFRN